IPHEKNHELRATLGGTWGATQSDYGGTPMRTALYALVALTILICATASSATTLSNFWTRSFGDVSFDETNGLAVVAANGDVVATGNFLGTVNFGAGPLTSAGMNDIWLARFDRKGNLKWAQRFGDIHDDFGLGVALDATGNVYLVADYVTST